MPYRQRDSVSRRRTPKENGAHIVRIFNAPEGQVGAGVTTDAPTKLFSPSSSGIRVHESYLRFFFFCLTAPTVPLAESCDIDRPYED